MPLPAAMLLPRDCLLPRTLRLLLLALLGTLGLRLLRALLLCGLLFRLGLFFVFLFVLRVRRDNHPEKQKQGSGTGSSNKLHSNLLLQGRLCSVHAGGQSAVRQCSAALPGLRLGHCLAELLVR